MLSYKLFSMSQYFPVHFTDLVFTRTLIYSKIWGKETVTNDVSLQLVSSSIQDLYQWNSHVIAVMDDHFNLTLRDSKEKLFSGFDTVITCHTTTY
jgi:hypothetical protein